jgi:hypothetical protein
MLTDILADISLDISSRDSQSSSINQLMLSWVWVLHAVILKPQYYLLVAWLWCPSWERVALPTVFYLMEWLLHLLELDRNERWQRQVRLQLEQWLERQELEQRQLEQRLEQLEQLKQQQHLGWLRQRRLQQRQRRQWQLRQQQGLQELEQQQQWLRELQQRQQQLLNDHRWENQLLRFVLTLTGQPRPSTGMMDSHSIPDVLHPTLSSFLENTRKLDLPRCHSIPDKLHPTLSSFLENMRKLDLLFNRLHNRVCWEMDPSKILDKLAASNAMFKTQQGRFAEFVQLSEEYANKNLLDISAEIQQQATVRDNLEKRLEAAKRLHGDAIDLQTFYESGTVANMKDLRTGRQSRSHHLPCCPRSQILRLYF